MIRERVVHDRGIVLAADGEEDAAITEAEGRALELLEGPPGVLVPELDARDAVVADDAAPQRVVEIEHEALRGRSQRAAERAREMAREHGLVRGGDRRPRERPEPGVGPSRRAGRRHESRVIPDVARCALRHAFEERAVQRLQLVGEGARKVGVEDGTDAMLRHAEARDERGAVRSVAEDRQRALDARQDVRAQRVPCPVGSVRRVRVDAEAHVGMEILEAHHDDERLGRVRPTFAGAPLVAEQGLLELPEAAVMDVDEEALPGSFDLQIGVEERRREAGQEDQAYGLQPLARLGIGRERPGERHIFGRGGQPLRAGTPDSLEHAPFSRHRPAPAARVSYGENGALVSPLWRTRYRTRLRWS